MLENLLRLEPTLKYAMVSHELHQDGNSHLHVALGWPGPRDIRDERHFDFEGFHPNLQSARSIKRVLDYVSKAGDVITHGDVPAFGSNAWSDVCNTSNKSDFFALIKEQHPKEFVLNYEKLEYFANKFFQPPRRNYEREFTTFNVPSALEQWVSSNLYGTGRRKSLFLCSPSRYGKTEWARSLGPHMYFNNMCNFKDDWDDNADYIIFDDMEWDYLPNKKGFFGMQKRFSITGKYMKTITVDWGKPAIYLCNNLPVLKEPEWWYANVDIITLNNKLF
jgi:hypothetical protein